MRKIIIAIAVLIIILSSFIYVFSLTPLSSKDWETGFEIFPEVTINENEVTVKNARNWGYSKTDIASFEYVDRTYKVEDLERVWFLVEPFSKFQGIAHTYFVFDFKDSEPISFSIEARREKGEKYSALFGLFNQYELIYMWGTEKDFTGRRIYKDEADVYMYPLNISKESGQKLFLELAKSTEELRNNPKFYNTLTSNCTSKLADHANRIKEGSIPFHFARILPGYSDEFLYSLDYIPTDKAIDEVKLDYYITDVVDEIYNEGNFSERLRMELQGE